MPEQIVFDPTNDGTKIISRSDDPTMLVFDEKTGGVKEVPDRQQGRRSSPRRAPKLLAMAVREVHPGVRLVDEVPLDVEWVLEGEEVWIVQARPYMSQDSLGAIPCAMKW